MNPHITLETKTLAPSTVGTTRICGASRAKAIFATSALTQPPGHRRADGLQLLTVQVLDDEEKDTALQQTSLNPSTGRCGGLAIPPR